VHQMVIDFANIALSSLSESEKLSKPELTKSLLKSIFTNSLQVLDFDQAYSALMANPDLEMYFFF
jgi:hypothetical protein